MKNCHSEHREESIGTSASEYPIGSFAGLRMTGFGILFASIRVIRGRKTQIKNFPFAMTCSSSSQMSKKRPTQSMWVVLFQVWPVCSQ